MAVKPKKRKPGRPRTTGKGMTIGARCHRQFVSRLDAWRKAQPDKPSRGSALRQIAEHGLKITGY
jgi:hypothetical protein